MFLKLTEISIDPDVSPTESEVFIKAEAIVKMSRRENYTSLYLGTNHWPYVKETPEQIIVLAGQYGIPACIKKEENINEVYNIILYGRFGY